MNFWKQLPNQTKTEIESLLTKKLGSPNNELNQNLLTEIIRKIMAYYFTEETEQNYTIYSTVGQVQEIIHKRFKEGPKKGQTYYTLILANQEKLQAKKELLSEEKWKQITNLALLGQNLVFKYKKWITNKQIIDFYPQGKKIAWLNQLTQS